MTNSEPMDIGYVWLHFGIDRLYIDRVLKKYYFISLFNNTFYD